MIPLAPEIAAMRPDVMPISVMVFIWHDNLYRILEWSN